MAVERGGSHRGEIARNATMGAAATLLVAACSSGALTVGTDSTHPASSLDAGSTVSTPSGADASSNDTGASPTEAGAVDPNCDPGPGPASYPPQGCAMAIDLLNACTANALCAEYIAYGATCIVCVQTVDSQGTPVRWRAAIGAPAATCSPGCPEPYVLPPGTNVQCLEPLTSATLDEVNAICARTPDCKACLRSKNDPNNPATWLWFAQQNASVCPCPP